MFFSSFTDVEYFFNQWIWHKWLVNIELKMNDWNAIWIVLFIYYLIFFSLRCNIDQDTMKKKISSSVFFVLEMPSTNILPHQSLGTIVWGLSNLIAPHFCFSTRAIYRTLNITLYETHRTYISALSFHGP